MAIEQFGKITYNDINNLNNESITTGNLTCTGNITCNTSGAGIVTANQYYGTKFLNFTLLIADFGDLSSEAVIPLSYKLEDFEFLSFSTTGVSNSFMLSLWAIRNSHGNPYGGYRMTMMNGNVFTFYLSLSENTIHVITGVPEYVGHRFWIIGYK